MSDWANLSDDEDSRLISEMRSSMPEVRPAPRPSLDSNSEEESPKVRRRSRPSTSTLEESTRMEAMRTPATEPRPLPDEDLKVLLNASSPIESPKVIQAKEEPTRPPLARHSIQNNDAKGEIGGSSIVSESQLRNMLQSIVDTSAEEKRLLCSAFKLQIIILSRLLLKELNDIKNSIQSSNPLKGEDPLRNEISEARKRIKDLEDENLRLKAEANRLKDEAAITDLRHKESLSLIIQRHEEEIKRKEDLHADLVRNLVAQHAQAVDSLRRIHLDELSRIKDRAGEGQTLEQVVRQIRDTLGGVRLIEEQLAQRQHGLDLAREGQFEARERLLADLEAKARERAEQAETECTISLILTGAFSLT